jgi:hypothetical protein
MTVYELKLESHLLGFPIIKLSGWVYCNEVFDYAEKLRRNNSKAYLYTEISATRLSDISLLESFGFRFSEFRIQMFLDLEDLDDYTKAFYPLKADLITNQEDLNQAKEFLSVSKSDDRFSSDPEIPVDFSIKRNLANIEKSFKSYPKEWLIGIYNDQLGTLEGFWSVGVYDDEIVHLFQHATSSNKSGIYEALDNLSFSLLKSKGFRWIRAISTGYNVGEINRFITHSCFKVSGSSVILRMIIK